MEKELQPLNSKDCKTTIAGQFIAIISGKRSVNITVIGMLTLAEGAILIAFGISTAFANRFDSYWTTFIFGHIDTLVFHYLRVALGITAVTLGASSLAVGLGTLAGKKWAWPSNLIVSSLGIAVLLATCDIMYLPVGTLLISLVLAGTILANLFRHGTRSFFGNQYPRQQHP
jgi:hypothetical protein